MRIKVENQVEPIFWHFCRQQKLQIFDSQKHLNNFSVKRSWSFLKFLFLFVCLFVYLFVFETFSEAFIPKSFSLIVTLKISLHFSTTVFCHSSSSSKYTITICLYPIWGKWPYQGTVPSPPSLFKPLCCPRLLSSPTPVTTPS